MRPLWRWIVHGNPKPPTVIHAEWTSEDPRTDALKAIAASADRLAVAAEFIAAALDRAEQRALGPPPLAVPVGITPIEEPLVRRGK